MRLFCNGAHTTVPGRFHNINTPGKRTIRLNILLAYTAETLQRITSQSVHDFDKRTHTGRYPCYPSAARSLPPVTPTRRASTTTTYEHPRYPVAEKTASLTTEQTLFYLIFALHVPVRRIAS